MYCLYYIYFFIFLFNAIRLCDSYDALPNTSSKQTTPTALYNPSFASLNSQQHMSNGTGNENSTIYKCSSDCCSVERQQRHNHNSQHSHFNHNNNNNNNNNINNGSNNKHRKQKTSKQQQQQQQHHHLRQSNNNNSNKQPQKQSPQEPEYHNHNIVNVQSDQNHVNYEYIGESNGIGDDGEDMSIMQTDVNAISENDEEDVTTEHDEEDDEEEDDEVDPINSYSCDDTITDEIVLAGSNHIDRRNNKANKYFNTENGLNTAVGVNHCEHTNGSGGSRGSGSGGDTCCSCSDVSCVYEEPPNHPPMPINKSQMLRIGEDN